MTEIHPFDYIAVVSSALAALEARLARIGDQATDEELALSARLSVSLQNCFPAENEHPQPGHAPRSTA